PICGLPEPLDLEALLQLPEPQVTQVEKKLSSAPAREEEPNPFADDAIHLNVEDFVLDLHPSSAPVNEAPPALPAESGVGAPSIPGAVASAEALPAEEPGEEVAAPVIRPDFIKPSKVFSAEPAAALPPEPVEIPVEGRAAEEFGQETPESPETVPDYPEPTPPPSESAALDSSPAAASAVTAESRGLAYVMEVARDYLGPLGRTLLKKEAAPLSLQGRDWTETQVRELVLRFFRSSQWILGRARSERMLEKIRERVEV
ncbi:MAG: hypothetical protein HGA76_09795, partial [Candidatus Firestonebacteria bacterium]|nr:hypothetical protein [Candidatus Firestonebacteria bacterium]